MGLFFASPQASGRRGFFFFFHFKGRMGNETSEYLSRYDKVNHVINTERETLLNGIKESVDIPKTG